MLKPQSALGVTGRRENRVTLFSTLGVSGNRIRAQTTPLVPRSVSPAKTTTAAGMSVNSGELSLTLYVSFPGVSFETRIFWRTLEEFCAWSDAGPKSALMSRVRRTGGRKFHLHQNHGCYTHESYAPLWSEPCQPRGKAARRAAPSKAVSGQ